MPFMEGVDAIRRNAAKRLGLSWGDSSVPCGIYIMLRRRRDTIGMRKLKIKRFLKIPSIGKVTVTSFLSSKSSYKIEPFLALRDRITFFSEDRNNNMYIVMRPRAARV